MISTETLQQQLSNQETGAIRIFDCRFSLADFNLGRKQYLEGHLPGAFHLDMEQHLSGAKGVHGGRHPLPDPETFATTLRGMGVNRDTKIVAYDDNRLAGAARLWWLLQYFGHQRAQILDGGFRAWRNAQLPVSQELPRSRPGNFEASPAADQTRDYLWLKEHLKDTKLQLIDAREAPRYRGLEEPIDPIAGHIPGALNHPWQEVTDDTGFVLSPDTQQARWQDLDPHKETLVYCGSGVTACVNLLSLKLTGYENAKLYPGSWSDWCSFKDSATATNI